VKNKPCYVEEFVYGHTDDTSNKVKIVHLYTYTYTLTYTDIRGPKFVREQREAAVAQWQSNEETSKKTSIPTSIVFV
jgi:hypothetical protein